MIQYNGRSPAACELVSSLPLDMGEAPLTILVNHMAVSIARELSEMWPFEVRRIQVLLFGAFSQSASRRAFDLALLLGLSGLEVADLEDPDRARAFRLRDRMMAIRLSRRSLVAFHPDRDIGCAHTTLGLWPDRVRVIGLPFGAGPVRFVERIAKPDLLGFY